MTFYMIGDPQKSHTAEVPLANRTPVGGGSTAAQALAPYSVLNPPPTLATPLVVDIPILPPGELERLSVEYSQTRDVPLRDRLVIYHQRLVRSIATRFLSMGESLEDLIQVGNIGLINALDRYDPSQGTRFSTYATPTILGEIKRYFRDKTAVIKVPRWLQELSQQIRHASHALTHELGRVPKPAEIAVKLQVTEDEVLQAMESGEASNPL
ncbi:MAG: sigma-70 family RNA polymerase sigma factor, partial [Proteobacteria bacterium]